MPPARDSERTSILDGLILLRKSCYLLVPPTLSILVEGHDITALL